MPVFVILLQDSSYKKAISAEACAQSGLMTDLLSDVDTATMEAGVELPLDVGRPDIMDLVIEFMESHVSNPVVKYVIPINTNNIEEVVGKQDAEFLETKVARLDDLVDLILAANYLNCEGLLNIGVAKLATMLYGGDIAKICERFGVDDDITLEEERDIRERNMWLFEMAYLNEINKAQTNGAG